jgi:ABC-type nitrate/sulfonate/bicarbonate transport system substrate-binding protein
LGRKNKPSVLSPVSVSLKWIHQAQFAGLYVAKEKGFYEKERIDVQLIPFDENGDQIGMLESGKAMFAVMNPTELLKAIDNGFKGKAIAVIYETSPYSVISLKGTNIATPADFEGKTLGVKGDNVEGKVLYEALMDEFNIDKSNVHFLTPGFDTTVLEDLVSKKVDVIDVYRTDQVYLFEQLGETYNLMNPELFGFQAYGDVLVTTDTMIENNPDLVGKFVSATIQGWNWALDNQAQTIDLTMNYITNKQYQDKAYQQFILSQSEPLIRSVKSKSIGPMNYLVWRKMVDTLRRNGVVKKDIDARSAYTTEFLP